MRNFGQHIYIVSSYVDGQDQTSKDWIASFHRFLELLLSRLSGEKVKINSIDFRDLDLSSIYTSSTMLLPIVSDELLDSPVFKQELKVFHEKSINKSSNNLSWNSRIFKILRKPQKGHYLLDYLSDSVNYEFFHIDESTDELVFYDDFTGPNSEKTFWMRLYDLAYDIFKVVDEVKSVESQIASISNQLNSVSVYLAEVGIDLIPARDSMKRELQRNGYKVLPESKLPSDLDSIMKFVKKNLRSSNLSIHLVGSDYSTIQGSNVSIIDLQNRIASDHFNELEKMNSESELNFGRIVWVSPELNNVSVKQRLFIENLKKDSSSMNRAELLETTIEELKSYVVNKIQDEVEKYNKFKGHKESKKGKIIYLIHSQSDVGKCKKIVEFLTSSGYQVITTEFKGNPDEVRLIHNENLKKCDASLIYYGNDNENWIKSKQKDLLKSAGLGRDKPISPQAVLIENEMQLDESLGLGDKALVLQGSKRFSAKVMEPFLTQLEK